MNQVLWKDPNNRPDALIQWLSKNSIPNGGNLLIKLNQFFTSDDMLFSELNCLVEFFKFDIPQIDSSLKSKLIIESLMELILEKMESSENLLVLVNEKLLNTLFLKEYKFCLTSLSCESIPFKKITVFDSQIHFYKNFPSKFKSRYFLKGDSDNYIKCVISTKTASNELNAHMDNLDILRALWNIFLNNEWGMVMHDNPQPINKIRLGKYHSLHNEIGEIFPNSHFYDSKFVEASLINVSNISKKILLRNLDIIARCNYRKDIIESLLLFLRALDEWDQNLSFSILWNAIEKLLSRKGKNESRFYIPRCLKIFRNKMHMAECVNALRLIRNKYVHNYDNYHDARTLNYLLKNIYREILAFHLSKLHSCATLNLAINKLDENNFL